jgi:hypothetical protein
MSDAASGSTLPPRYADGRFGPGNPGRRRGSRNQVSHRIIMGILEHFESQRERILNAIIFESASAYVALLGRLLPRQIDVAPSDFDDFSDADLATMIARARAMIEDGGDARGALVEVEAILTPQAAPDPHQR